MNNDLNGEIIDKNVKNLYEYDMLKVCKNAALEMQERVLFGTIIKDYTTEDGERILLTKTENNTDGYAVFEKGNRREPHYIVESHYYFDDFEKQTAHNGVGLRYDGAKSRIQRNMLGMFFEYIKDPGFEGLYASIQMPDQADVHVSQQMTGYYNEDPVTIMAAQFDRKEFSIAAFVQKIMDTQTGKPTLRIGLGGFDEKGAINHEQMLVDAKLAEGAKKFFGERAMGEERLKTVINDSMDLSQATFYRMYEQLGILVNPDIKPNNLIEDSLNRYIQEHPGKFLTDGNERHM